MYIALPRTVRAAAHFGNYTTTTGKPKTKVGGLRLAFLARVVVVALSLFVCVCLYI